MRQALARLIPEPGERVATIAANAAQQMLGPVPARCICNEARAHEIIRDSLLYAIGRRDSPFYGAELTAAQERALARGRQKAIEAQRARSGQRVEGTQRQVAHGRAQAAP